MKSVESSIHTTAFDCEDAALRHGPLRSSELFDQSTNLPHFIFTPTGSVICAYTPSRLHCQFSNGREFFWAPSSATTNFSSLENWPVDTPLCWSIVEANFLASTSYLVVLLSLPPEVRPQRSLVCLLNLDDVKSFTSSRFISLRGRAEAIHLISADKKSILSFNGVVAVAFGHGLVALLGET